MFAVRKIIDGKLYAAETEDGSDAFTDCFKDWQDPIYLRNYLKGKTALQEYYGLGIKEASKKILKEGKIFFTDIYRIANNTEGPQKLDNYIFEPLHKNDDLQIPHLSSKAYGSFSKPSFLRLYAIRLSDGCYIVVAGLLKMDASLQDSEEGKAILQKLKVWSEYLEKNNIDDAFDLGELIL